MTVLQRAAVCCIALAAWGCQPETSPSGTAPFGARPGAAANGSNAPGAAAASGGAAQAAGAPADCSLMTPAPRRLWRLTATQYDNTLKDLLGIDSSVGAGFPADDVGVGFGNAADALLMTPLLADKLQSAAEDIANTAELARLAPCASSAADDNCLREVVTRFGMRAFRRPLAPTEVDTYFMLGKSAGAFEGGARLVVNAMLQSPNFLYRSELGKPSASAPGVFELDDYEVASELSYLLWQSMPDEALFQAAERGELRDLAQRQAQVERMLKADRARPVVRKFVFDWLGLSTIATVPKDTTRYPELTAEIRAAMEKEAERFVDNVMFGADTAHDGSIRALLEADTTFLDAKLASFYAFGAAADSGVQLTAQERRGILTLGGVLLTHSRSNDSSPIHRGKLVREKLLCQPLPPPPPGLVLQPPGLDPTKTARQRYAAHSENAFCGNCHKLMDPIGLAFEHFDGIGRFRADDNGLPIDPSGEIVPNENQAQASSDADGPFMNSAQLIEQLANSQDVAGCYALQWFRFAYGEGKTERDSDAYPSCQAKSFQAAMSGKGGSLREIVNALTQSDWFLTRSGSAAPAGATQPQVTQPPADMAKADPPAAMQAGAGTVDMQAQPGLQVERTVDNDWGMGYCYTYQLRNTTSAPITWSVPLDVRGKMNNHWECQVTGDSGSVVFTGEDHNKTIEPNGMAQFGFCAMTGS
ncbi:MAG TPA: DUF1592 domain-containing protein [Polyangiales bacterium]|nr:DUF1592 domain-containing protein [Polyangiales bacterium]